MAHKETPHVLVAGMRIKLTGPRGGTHVVTVVQVDGFTTWVTFVPGAVPNILSNLYRDGFIFAGVDEPPEIVQDDVPHVFIEVVQRDAGRPVVVRTEISMALVLDGKLGSFMTGEIHNMLREMEQRLSVKRR